MKKSTTTVFAFLVIFGLFISACSEKTPEELTSPIPDIPIPTGLSAVVGNDSITVSWVFDQTFTYSGFVLYRSEDGGNTYQKIGEAVSPPIVDKVVRTGAVYFYRVAGIDAAGVEGPRSTFLVVEPSQFGVLIDNGAQFTNDLGVFLGMTAPSGTQRLRISEDPTFSGAAFQLFQVTKSFDLQPGDGLKIVYASFIGPNGHMTETVSDSIILDTQTSIQSASYTPASPVAKGGTLHFVVTPAGNELEGSASIDIGGIAGSVKALDDGSLGDPTAGDGVYERDYTLPATYRQVGATVSATFTDAASNVSASFDLAMLTISDPPPAVTLFPVVDSTVTTISLRWGQSSDPNFDRYEIFRDTTPTVSKDTSARATTISTASTNMYTDTGLNEGETYYYVVYVVNDLEEFQASNVRMAATDDVLPTPVVCDDPTSVTANRLTLTWSQNNDSDFQEYRVYRATSAGVTNASLLVATITNRGQTFVDDTGLDTVTNDYFYRVFVIDKGGNEARSNEVSTAP